MTGAAHPPRGTLKVPDSTENAPGIPARRNAGSHPARVKNTCAATRAGRNTRSPAAENCRPAPLFTERATQTDRTDPRQETTSPRSPKISAAGAPEKDSLSPAPVGFCDPRGLAGLPPKAPLAVALSGGADSVALLLLVSPPVVAVHVHHGIRGAEADRDADFCRTLCRERNIPFTCLFADVPALAAKSGESLETAARRERYRLLEEFAKTSGASAVLTAHHADDQLETLLQHLLRGSGLRGMCGIPAVRALGDTQLVRPMLGVKKEDILAFLAARGQSYVTDSTNAKKNCQRNRLRLEVLPLLKAIAPDAAKKAAATAAHLSADEAYFTAAAAEFLRVNGNEPPAAALTALPRPVFVRVIQHLVPVDLSALHFDALFAFLQKNAPHASLSLPHLRARTENGRLVFDTGAEAPTGEYLAFLQPGDTPVPNVRVLVRLGETANNPQKDPKNLYKYATSVSFLSDKVKGKLFVRPRRPGDQLFQGGMHKAVRRLPGLAALPAEVRARMPLLLDDAGILAVPFGALRDGADGKDQNNLTVWFYFD